MGLLAPVKGWFFLQASDGPKPGAAGGGRPASKKHGRAERSNGGEEP